MIEKLHAVWHKQPDKVMLINTEATVNYQQFLSNVELYKHYFVQHNVKSLAICIDNSFDWVYIDIACQQLDIVLLPLPTYFSQQQIQHSISTAACDLLIIEQALTAVLPLAELSAKLIEHHNQLAVYQLSASDNEQACLPPTTSKITFTSGTTGDPKGACLTAAHQWQVAESIATAVSQSTVSQNSVIEKHLCVLPLATLLENIAGIYAPLLNGASVEIPSLTAVGFSGSSSLDFNCFINKITEAAPSSFITTPELLKGLILACQQGWQAPKSLTFIAVGGAHVDCELLTQAHQLGLPAYQGYGLSECCSVVSLNTAKDNKLTSVGKVLPHSNVSIEAGEIIVHDAVFLGYAGDKSSWQQTRYATGDLGYLDEQQFLHIQGRKKNTLISSFGRNINPEWIEARLLAINFIQQAIVFGEAKPFCCAAIYVIDANLSSTVIDQAIADINASLPDYAQIKAWFLLDKLITSNSTLMTANGRIRRVIAEQAFSKQIAQAYH